MDSMNVLGLPWEVLLSKRPTNSYLVADWLDPPSVVGTPEGGPQQRLLADVKRERRQREHPVAAWRSRISERGPFL